MKLFAFILAVFTLSLTMFPCEDELLVYYNGEAVMNDREHNGHEHQEGVDYCSPFCVCAITIDVKTSPDLAGASLIEIDNSPKFVYIEPITLESTNNVFQPPQFRG